MSIYSDNGFSENYLVFIAVNFLLEGLDAIEHQREWTDREEELAAILEELSSRFLKKIYPDIESGVPMIFSDRSFEDLWSRASAIMRGEFNPLSLISHRDEEQPRGACRFCAVEKKILS